MKVSEFGKSKGQDYHPTPPYGVFSAEKQDKQNYETFSEKGKQFKDSQDLMGGPQRKSLEGLTPSDKAFHAKEKLAQVAMKSWGRFHE